MLKAEGFKHHRQLTLAFTQQAGTQHLCQLMHGHFRGINDQIGTRAQRLQQIAFLVDSTFQRQIFAGERMQTAGITIATDQRIAIGIKEQQLR